MISFRFKKNFLHLLYFILSFTIALESAKAKNHNNHFLTQHGNLICKGQIESKDMKTSKNGHLYSTKVFFIFNFQRLNSAH